MSEIELVWHVDDGYVTGTRPQTMEVDPAEFEGLTPDEVARIVAAAEPTE